MTSWDDRVAQVWATAKDRDEDDVVAAVRVLVAECPDTAAAHFEWASALDFAGREAEAEPAYRAALAAGLDDDRRGQAVVQLASTLRNLGRPAEALALLADGLPHLDDAVVAFRALALCDLGRPRDATRQVLLALAPHLPRYAGAVRYYAQSLTPDVALRAVVDESLLDEIVAAATSDADPDDVTPSLGDGWTHARVEWLRAYHRERFAGVAGPAGEGTWAIGAPVLGVVRLRHLGECRWETGLWLARSARGHGVGRAALRAVTDLARTLGARELVADTTPDNAPALALLTSAGFTLSETEGSVRASMLMFSVSRA